MASPATKYSLATVALIIAGFAFTFSFVEPPPPRTISIATGGPSGAYAGFAQRYARELAREGITLEVVETAGSVENLALLDDPAAPVELALIQGGLGPAPGTPPGDNTDSTKEALASVFFEPVWVFHNGAGVTGADVDRLSQLAGRRIAVGGEGSGTAALALKLLAENGITGSTAQLVPIGGAEAVSALTGGGVDAVFLVSSPRSTSVTSLLAAPGIRLMSFARAEAYPQRFAFMSTTTLHAGAADLAAGVPPADVTMPAPVAGLVARADLHPALVPVIMQAITNVHHAGSFFSTIGEFPSAGFTEFPLNDQARRFLDRGAPFLQRFMPFWIANFIDRMVVMLIPLLTLLIPLIRLAPPLYHWRMKSRINRLYGALAHLEEQHGTAAITPQQARTELAGLAETANGLSVPPSFYGELYTMRFHLDRMRAEFAGQPGDPAPVQSLPG